MLTNKIFNASALEKVSFQVLGSIFSIAATRLGSSAEPSQQVC